MGYAIAAAAQQAGADVILVSGPVSLATPPGVKRLDVESAQGMYEAVHEHIDGTDLFIACAAVSDYRPQKPSARKIKRLEGEVNLELIRSLDTLASVAALDEGPFTVGFAAETEDVTHHAAEKLKRKCLDMIAANRVGPDCGFDQESNSLTVMWDDDQVKLERTTKPILARRLIELIAKRYRVCCEDNSSSSQMA